MEEKISPRLGYRLTYMNVQGDEIVFVKLEENPQLIEKVKWSFLGDPESYSFAKFNEKLSQIPHKRGDSLTFYLVNEEAGRLAEVDIDISEDWPLNLTTGRTMRADRNKDISQALEELEPLE